MESLLWMLDLLALVFLCFWALREDRRIESGEKNDAQRGND